MMFLIAVVAGLAGIAHLIYRDEQAGMRRLIAAFLVSGFTGLMVFGFLTTIYSGPMTGYVAVAIASACGTYTDIILRGSQVWVKNWMSGKGPPKPPAAAP
jgi:hypothetical protein